jgi:hypothetical protein
MNKIAINFRDNDFVQTHLAFGNALLKILCDDNLAKKIDKDYIIELYKRSISGIFWAFQDQLDGDLEWDPSTYLKLEHKHIFFDDEVNNLLNGDYFTNSELLIVDKYAREEVIII